MAWYNSSWNYRKQITIGSGQVGSTLINFPVYLDGETLGSHFFANTNAGSDVRITDINGSELPREIVSVDTTGSTAEIHFKADLGSESDNIFYVYYGNQFASDYASSDTYGAKNVWTNYDLVLHYDEDPTTPIDSTGSYTMTGIGMTSADLIGSGIIGNKGVTFEKAQNNSIITTTNGAITGNAARSYSTWLYFPGSYNTGTNRANIVLGMGQGTTGASFTSTYTVTNTVSPKFTSSYLQRYFEDVVSGSLVIGSESIFDKWTHFAITYPGTDSYDIKFYVNGSHAETINIGAQVTFNTASTPYRLGSFPGWESSESVLTHDEFRLYRGEISGERMLAEYTNQGSPTVFLTSGSLDERSIGSSWYNNAWLYRQQVIIGSEQVGSPLADFPVYINESVLGSDFFIKTNSGSDIRITDYTGSAELPREVVSVNTTGSTAEIYFKANLSNIVNNIFYVYYGNSEASDYNVGSPFGANNVWTNYEAVWHFKDVNNFSDSTGNGYSGSNVNNVINNPGKFGNAGSFINGTDNYLSITQQLGNYSGLRLSTWVYPNSFSANSCIFANREPGKGFQLYTPTSGSTIISMITWNDAALFVQDNPIPVGSWHNIIYSNNPTGSSQTFYVNGSLLASGTGSSPIDTAAVSARFANDFYNNDWNGMIDETRLSGSALGGDYDVAEYNNLNNPTTFLTSGSTEELPLGGSWYDSAWAYRKKITIPASQVGSDLVDFPVYVNEDVLGTGSDVYLNAGSDLRFTGSDGATELPREVVTVKEFSLGSLVAQYKFNESSGDAIASVGGANLTEVGTVPSTTGKINGARGNLTTSNRFTTNDNNVGYAWDTSKDISFSFWFNKDAASGESDIIFDYNSAAGSDYVRMIWEKTPYFEMDFRIYGANGSVMYFRNNGANTDYGSWTHWSCVYDGTNKTASIYKNGAYAGSGYFLSGSFGSPTNGNQSSTLDVGHSAVMGNNWKIDDLRIYDKVLTADDVTLIYNEGNGTEGSFLTGSEAEVYFKADLSSTENNYFYVYYGNGSAEDYPNTQRTSISVDHYWPLENSGADTGTVGGITMGLLGAGSYSSFSKVGSYSLYCGTSASNSDGASGSTMPDTYTKFSFFTWIYIPDIGSYGTIFQHNEDASWGHVMSALSSNGSIYFYNGNGTSAEIMWTDTGSIVAGEWIHLAGNITTGSRVRLWVNGVQQSIFTGSITTVIGPRGPNFWLGRAFNSNGFGGYIDNFKVALDKDLTTEDVLLDYNNGSGLVGSVEVISGSPYAGENVWSNYEAVWHLNGNESDSVGINTLTENGTIPIQTGIIGNSRGTFSDTNKFTNNAFDSPYSPDTSISVSWWAKRVAAVSDNHIMFRLFDDDLTAGTPNVYLGHANGNNWYFEVSEVSGSNATINTGGVPTLNEWVKVDVVYDANNNIVKGYLDNTIIGSDDLTSSSTSVGSRLIIGAHQVAGQSARSFYLDDMRVGYYAKSEAELGAEYTNQNTPTTFLTAGAQESQTSTGDPAYFGKVMMFAFDM